MALGPDRIDHAGPGFERHYELALSGRRIDGGLRWWEPVRTGAKQPVVDDSGDIARQWFGDGGVPRNAGRRYFYWSGY